MRHQACTPASTTRERTIPADPQIGSNIFSIHVGTRFFASKWHWTYLDFEIKEGGQVEHTDMKPEF